ncbi:50S ribosomal protein L13 [Petrotoga miotherma DSM 10691]|uniref:Large ribosomal subunit protein uL13 n=1 Tax=Petrotoga miotherma DSM 10691 TaxID=1434326 RepID=A0A2K1PBH9_9BACT|nr:50S ribosomal protein L13 [Petrotoga miotherma]MDN5345859.1 large subunit ribosomal protein [Petrotoga sp.]PNS00037.1 50S ribosomal protein L13 [Petrotoga miotherma DSM 10691]
MNSKLVQPSYTARKEDIKREWFLIDAKDYTLGRLASRIAKILQGKHKPNYTPHIDCGDFVIVVNAEKIKLSKNKKENKVYRRYSGYPGGLKEISFEQMYNKHPERIIKLAVKGMMPKTILAKHMMKKLKVYVGPDHPHQAQKPKEIKIENI